MATPITSIVLPPEHVIQWKPKSFSEARHNSNPVGAIPYTLDLVFNPQIESAGNYTFWLNGAQEGYAYDPEASTATTETDLLMVFVALSGDIHWDVSALGGITNLYGADTAYRITRIAPGDADHFRFFISGKTVNPPVQVFLQNAGNVTADISGQLAKFDYAETAATVDKSGVNSRYESLDEGRHSMVFNLTILSNADQDLDYLIYDGAIGELTLYEGRIVTGVKYGKLYAIIEEVKKSVSDAGVETTIRGRRIGAPILPFGTIL